MAYAWIIQQDRNQPFQCMELSIYRDALLAGLPARAARHAVYIETLDGPEHARAFVLLAKAVGHVRATEAFDVPARSCRGAQRVSGHAGGPSPTTGRAA